MQGFSKEKNWSATDDNTESGTRRESLSDESTDCMAVIDCVSKGNAVDQRYVEMT